MTPAIDAEFVRDAFAASARGYEGMRPFIHDEFEMTTLPAVAAEPGVYRGPEGVKRWWDEFYEVMEEVRLAPIEVLSTERDDVFAIEFDIVARGGASGIETVQRSYALATVADAKLIGLEFFLSLEDALASVA